MEAYKRGDVVDHSEVVAIFEHHSRQEDLNDVGR
jgi:hypothetical protein